MSYSDQDILNLLTPFVDGELPEEAARSVERHIENSPTCRQLVAAERATKRAVATRSKRHTAPVELKHRIRAVLFEGADAPGVRAKPARPFLWRLITESPAAATAVGVLVLAAALTVVIVLFNANRITPFIRDVYAHHTDGDQYPIEITGDHESVAAETSKAVAFPVTVPHLDEDLSLSGARKCQLCGHLMAFIRYEGTDGLVSFFVIPKVHVPIWRLEKHAQDEMVFRTAHHQGVRMVFWHEEATTYCLAASVAEERLIRLACTACREIHTGHLATATARRPSHRLLAPTALAR